MYSISAFITAQVKYVGDSGMAKDARSKTGTKNGVKLRTSRRETWKEKESKSTEKTTL